MALTHVNNGDDADVARAKINDSFDQADTNSGNITVIQSKSFLSPSTALIQNNNAAVYVDTDLLISITTKSASSKLRVNFAAPFYAGNTAQTGIKGHIQSNIDSAGWNNILYGNQTNNFILKDPDTVNASDEWPINSMSQIDSPGIGSIVQFKVTFAPVTDANNVDYRDDRGIRMITVDEILE